MGIIMIKFSAVLTVVVLLSVAQLVVRQAAGEATEQQRRRPLFRRAKPTTTSEPAAAAAPAAGSGDDSEGSETKRLGSDPFSGHQPPGLASGSFKADTGDKLTTFSEYSFGSHAKLPGGSDETATGDDTDPGAGYGGFKNHKSAAAGLLPTTNANNKERKPFDFLARDYAKAKGSFGAGASTGATQHDTGLLAGLKSKASSTVSNKYSISHPSPISAPGSSKAAGKLAHLDDSTEYDVYASLGQSQVAGKTKLGTSSGKYRPLGAAASSSSLSSSAFGAPSTGHFEGKVKKVPFKYEDGGLGAASSLKGKTKGSKLALDDDSPFGAGTGLGGFDGAYGGKPHHHHQQQQSQQSLLASSKSKFNFAEPPALVKSTLNTLKHFGDGLLGNGNPGGALIHAPNPYELDSDEVDGLASVAGTGGFHGGAGKYGSPGQGSLGSPVSHFGHPSHGAIEESYEVASGEHHGKPAAMYQLPKLSPSLAPLSSVVGGVVGGGKFATDFDVKNIKLTDGGASVFGGHSTKYQVGGGATGSSNTQGYTGKHTPHHTKQQQHQQQQQQQLHPHQGVGHAGPGQHLHHHQQQQQQQHGPHHAPPHATPHATGAGIAAKGQIESFLNSEHGLKDESLVAQLLGQQQSGGGGGGAGAGRPHYHTLQKSKEEEQLEKEALRQQIEYLKAQAAKRPVDLSPSNPARPAIVSNAQKFRPVRRIPTHVRLGVKAPYPLPRIPHYNDRPYSISFKI
ncbi:uncharacterized protein LOC125955925 [Anopheles darlingi]|uniref:uncharacterized protein LOC125955925 n=1 Tax=Anopheles darlingi TaxID=43151 RepID=UPI0021000AEB|nr:uncharacterized protein LOC125955925 [Anopheles darlingi]